MARGSVKKLSERSSGEAKSPASNYRKAVGRHRRRQTELKILRAALRVFAKKGPDSPVIDDFIRAAKIARGTFYNHFKNTQELRQATSDWLTDNIVSSIHARVGRIKHPGRRLATALRLWMSVAESDREWCAFVAHVQFLSNTAYSTSWRDISDGLKQGVFHCPSPEAGMDLNAGTLQHAMIRLVREPHLQNYGDSVVRAILQGLGMERTMIDEVMSDPLPEMPQPHKSPQLDLKNW